jgi:hypothetical protein
MKIRDSDAQFPLKLVADPIAKQGKLLGDRTLKFSVSIAHSIEDLVRERRLLWRRLRRFVWILVHADHSNRRRRHIFTSPMHALITNSKTLAGSGTASVDECPAGVRAVE